MSTFLLILVIAVGVLGLLAGGLIWLFFHQGGCCVRRVKAKLTGKDYVSPVLR
jgi:hypothetical protein